MIRLSNRQSSYRIWTISPHSLSLSSFIVASVNRTSFQLVDLLKGLIVRRSFHWLNRCSMCVCAHLIGDHHQQIENASKARRQSTNILFSHIFLFHRSPSRLKLFQRCLILRCSFVGQAWGIWIIRFGTVDQKIKKKMKTTEWKYWQAHLSI